jgi:hypothetical protein
MFRRRDRRDDTAASDDAGETRADAELDQLDELDEDELDEELEDQPEDMTADLESQAADYLAGNDVWMYGPNAEAILEILDRLEEIVPDEARPLAEAWLAIPKSDRERARKAARKMALENEEIARHLQLVREAVGTWLAVTGQFPEFVNAEPAWGRIAAQAAEAALDAATAVVLEGKLEESHYEALLEPWSETMAQLDAADEAARLAGAGVRESGADEADAEEVDDEADEVEEDEAEAEFGPNSDTVTDFLNRLWLLTPEQVGRLVSGWQNADRDGLKAAHEALRALVEEDPEWREDVRRGQEKLAPWLNAARLEAMAGFLGQAGQGESRKMAGPTLADAIAALILGDLLDRRDADALYGPWFNLIGAPQLPVAEEEEPVEVTGKVAARTGATAVKTGAGKAAAKPAAKSPAAKPAAKPPVRPAAKPPATSTAKPKAPKKK